MTDQQPGVVTEESPSRTAGTSVREEYDVPEDGDVQECRYCGRPLPGEQLLALHHGVDHPDRLTDEERAAFEDAYEDESDDLRQFRIAALGLLVLLYFGLLILYALV